MYIEIKDGRKKTYPVKEDIKSFGLHFKKTGKYIGKWTGDINNENIDAVRQFCKKKHLNLYIKEEGYYRSGDYSKLFFDSKKGIKGNADKYRCVYCGKVIRRSRGQVTVDHLFPVASVKNNSFWHVRVRQILDRLDIKDINQIENLVPACGHCNSSKGSKLGIWTIRGYLGQFDWFWYTLYFSFFLILILIIGLNIRQIL